MTGVPFCPEPWSEIVPGLWMGGHDYMPDDGDYGVLNAVVGNEFDLVLSLYQRWGCGPDAGVQRRYVRIPDGTLNDDDMAEVRRFALMAADRVLASQKVLVRCQAGYNRSGLVVAFALMHLGHSSDAAITLIRERRSQHALCNESFVGYIHAEAVRV